MSCIPFFTILLLMILSMLIQSKDSEDKVNVSYLIPKLELHAHLHGSIRQSTLNELAQNANDSGASLHHLTGSRDLAKCFGIFAVIHRMIKTSETLTRIIREVLDDFMADNVIYLELRSTPRDLEDGTTRWVYVSLLITEIEEHNRLHGHRMIVRLLLSLDRSKSLQQNTEIADLAMVFKPTTEVLVGIDLSGNPSKGQFEDYVTLLQQCRDAGFYVTVHAGEVPDAADSDIRIIQQASNRSRSMTSAHGDHAQIRDEVQVEVGVGVDGQAEMIVDYYSEMDSILSFWPDRLGHALYLRPRHVQMLLDAHAAYTQDSRIDSADGNRIYSVSPPNRRAPLIEICPSSNSYTLLLEDLRSHPTLATWIGASYPIAISTDDSGVFATSLSREISLVQQAFDLKTQQVVAMAVMPIEHIFSPELKEVVQDMFNVRLGNRLVETETKGMEYNRIEEQGGNEKV